jgi:hypothetical protein
MQCEEFEDHLNTALDERRRPEWDDELRLHCDTCPGCRETAAAYAALFEGFNARSIPLVSEDMAERVLDELRVRASRTRRLSFAGAALATAAALLIAMVPLRLAGPRATAPRPTPQAIARLSPAPHAPVPLSSAEIARLRMPGAVQSMWPTLYSIYEGDPYSNLAKGTGQGLATLVLNVPGIGGTRGIIDVDDQVVESQPAWAVEMSEGLKPVTETVTGTLYLLWRTLPLVDRS